MAENSLRRVFIFAIKIMIRFFRFSAVLISGIVFSLKPSIAQQSYTPPSDSAALLARADLSNAREVNTDYAQQFTNCDGLGNPGERDRFRGHSTRRPGLPDKKQYYLCSKDPSNLRALLRLPDGGIYWHSKMALDVDGSWAAWAGISGATDQKYTSYRWPGIADRNSQAAQLDPDRIPFIVMPTDGVESLTHEAAPALGREFSERTGLRIGDFGVVVHRNKWTPAIIGDGGPFMRVGEGSARVFENLGQSRCRVWDAGKTRCIGPGNQSYPYKNYGLARDVLFIAWPGTADSGIIPENAIAKMCAMARTRLGLSGGACPP